VVAGVVVQPGEEAAQVGLELEHLRLFLLGQAIPLLLALAVLLELVSVPQHQQAAMVVIHPLWAGQAHHHLPLPVSFLLEVVVVVHMKKAQDKTAVPVVEVLVYIQRFWPGEQEIHQALHQVREVMVEMGKAVR
jgi:hypothetical protein